MTLTTYAFIGAITLLYAALNRLIGSGYQKTLSRYGTYILTSVLAIGICRYTNDSWESPLLLMGLGYALFRQFSPRIAFLGGQMSFHSSYEVPNPPWLTHKVLGLFGVKLDSSIYHRWSAKSFRIAGIVGGGIRGLYGLNLVFLSYYYHQSILGLILSIVAFASFGLIHWFWGRDGFRGKEENFRDYSEITVGGLLVAPQIWMLAV